MKFLQNEDKDLAREKELLKAGQAPGNGDKVDVKRYLQKTHNLTLAKDGCIVSLKRKGKNLVEREFIVSPTSVSTGLLASIHITLNHPFSNQLGMNPVLHDLNVAWPLMLSRL